MWPFSTIAMRRRRSRTSAIAARLLSEVSVDNDDVSIFMGENEFIDSSHIKEVIEVISSIHNIRMRANVSRGLVIFYMDN